MTDISSIEQLIFTLTNKNSKLHPDIPVISNLYVTNPMTDPKYFLFETEQDGSEKTTSSDDTAFAQMVAMMLFHKLDTHENLEILITHYGFKWLNQAFDGKLPMTL